jgi:hypothetical protein
MDDPDRFRAHAERCRKIANVCADPFDKKAWIKLAAAWLTLAELLEASPKLQSDGARALDGQPKTRAELLGEPIRVECPPTTKGKSRSANVERA